MLRALHAIRTASCMLQKLMCIILTLASVFSHNLIVVQYRRWYRELQTQLQACMPRQLLSLQSSDDNRCEYIKYAIGRGHVRAEGSA
jgi:hypothetical protein